MIKSMITPMASPMITPMIFSSSSDITRIFINLDDVATMYYETSAPITLTGSFEIPFKFSSVLAGEQWIYSDWESASNNRSIAILLTATQIQFFISTNGTSEESVSLSRTVDSKLYSGVATFTAGSEIKLEVDGTSNTAVTAITQVHTSGKLISFGREYDGTTGSNFFDGILADISVDDSVATPATFELNEPTANSENSVEGNNTVIYNNIPTSVREDFTLVPGVEWLGAELWNDATTVIGSDWTDDGGGVYTINGSAGGLLQPFGDDITSYIRSTFDYTAVSGGMRVGNSGIVTYSISGPRIVEGADATKFGFKRNTGTVVGELSNVTLKRLLTIA